MNYLFYVFAIFVLIKSVAGYNKGMVREIISFVSLIITSITFALVALGLTSYIKGKTFHVVLAVVMLTAIGIVKHLLDVVFGTAKILSKIPVVKGLDKIGGIVVGALEALLYMWALYMVLMKFDDIGIIKEILLSHTRNSEILTWVYEHNYLAYYVEKLQNELAGPLERLQVLLREIGFMKKTLKKL